MKRLLTKLMLFSILIAGVETLNAQTNVPTLISSNQVWDISGSPYLITQTCYVDSGVKVLVMPGVEIQGVNANNYFIIDGELQAIGTSDSLILLDNLQIQLQAKARSYDSATGTGALFHYCSFTSPGVGKMVIYVSGVSVKVENSVFTNTYYSLYVISGSQSTQRIDVLGCTFEDTTGMSSPIYTGGNNLDFNIVGNTFMNSKPAGSVFIYGRKIYMVDNYFNGINRISTSFHEAYISCNRFVNMKNGVELNLQAQDTIKKCVFTHNTLDSAGSTQFNDPMLKVNRLYNLNQSRFNNNNFLTKIGTGPKVFITGVNPTPSSSESVNFKFNYWVTTDSATIDTLIKDYADDPKIFGRADFSGFLSNLDSTCGDTSVTSSCQASYYLAIDTATPFNLFVVNTSTGTTTNTTYTWDFGDGNTSNDPSPSHTYNDFGKFYLCVTLFNASENCSSTYCDSIGIDSSGMLLKKGGFTIHVINEDELNGLNEQDFFEDIRIYPNPTGGKLIIETSDLNKEPMTIKVIDLAGKTLLETGNEGDQNFVLDLSSLKEGIYLLNLQQGQSFYTTKIVVNR